MKYRTIDEATHAWVSEFSTFPQSMIAKLMEVDIDSWSEVTTPSVCQRVYVYEQQEPGEISEILHDVKSGDDTIDTVYVIEFDNGEEVSCQAEDFENENEIYLPMLGWLWQFGDTCDDYWLEEMGGIQIMSECGFRIYHHEEWGYFFGIDGAGYNFYSEHWIPLYKARGLHWHDEQEV